MQNSLTRQFADATFPTFIFLGVIQKECENGFEPKYHTD